MTDQPPSQSSEPSPPGAEELGASSESDASDGTTRSFKDRVSGHAATVSGHATTVTNQATTLANERPEVAIGAAFAGGFLFAQILKRLGH